MKSPTVAYWLTTGLFSLAIAGSGLAKLTAQAPLVEAMEHLGYPLYLMPILGTAYLAAALALVVPGLPRLKEWAYAGVSFAMIGAFLSHLAAGDGLGASLPPLVLLGLALASRALRPTRHALPGQDEAPLGLPAAAR